LDPYGKVFYTLKADQMVIEQWRRQYDAVRPRSALGNLPTAPEAIIPMDQISSMH